MKSNTSIVNCLLVCSFLVLFSCTKNNDSLTPALAQNGVNDRLNADDLSSSTFAPGDSLVLTGDTSKGDETVLIQTYAPDANRVGFVSFNALGHQLSGNGGLDRSIMKFKLRQIPDSVRNNPPQIAKAILYLYQYHRPADQDPYTVSQGTDNSAELHRIVSNWDEGTVSWNNHPIVARGSANPLEDVVVIPAVTTPLPAGTTDDQALDITDMVRRMMVSGNKGFLLKLAHESEYAAGRSYGSCTCPSQNLRPRLVIYF